MNIVDGVGGVYLVSGGDEHEGRRGAESCREGKMTEGEEVW